MKNKIKYFLAAMLLYEAGVFATDTKQMIHNALAKYGITSNKQDCNTGKEPEYIHHTGKVKCKNHIPTDTNNCWDASTRLCKECPNGTVVSQRDHITCTKLKCPEGFKLIEVKDGKCPTGFRREPIKNNSCDTGFKAYTEQEATNNYKTPYKICYNLQGNFIVPIEFYNPGKKPIKPPPVYDDIWKPIKPNPIDSMRPSLQ